MGCGKKWASEQEEKEEARKHKEWKEARRKEEREGTSEALVRTAYSVFVDGEEIIEFVWSDWNSEARTKINDAKERAYLHAMKLREKGETREIKVIEYNTYETRTRETNEYLVANIPAGDKFPPRDF